MRGLMRAATPLAALVIFGATLGVFAQPAAAHATLEHTTPAANAHLSNEPAQVVLGFDQPVNVKLGKVGVVGPGGGQVSTGYTQQNGGRTVTIELRPGTGNGTYIVSYRIISLDTHPVSGGFFFRVGPPGATGASASGTSGLPSTTGRAVSAPENTIVRAVYAAARYAGFLGLLLLVGGGVFLTVLWPPGVPGWRVVRVVWLGYGLTVVGSMGELVLQAPYATGAALAGITASGFDNVLAGRFGIAHLVRLGLLAVTAPVLAGLSGRLGSAEDRDGTSRHARWPVLFAVPIGVGLLLTWAYSGHAGTTVPVLSVPSDVVHLAAMAVWLGGLVVLTTALLPAAGHFMPVTTATPMPPHLIVPQRTLVRWSRMAMVCVVALIASGTVQALLEVGGWKGLVTTAYGQLLLAKIAILLAVLAVANSSRNWVRRHYAVPALASATNRASTHSGRARRPGPEPSRSEIARLRRGVVAEIVLGVAAVAVATVLIQTEPGRTVLAPPPSAASSVTHPITRHGPYEVAVGHGDVVIHLKVDPAVKGVNYIYLGATRPNDAVIHVKQWTLTVSNDALGLHQVNIDVLKDIGVGHRLIYGSFTMPVGGAWTFHVVARTSDVDETVVTRTVRVRP